MPWDLLIHAGSGGLIVFGLAAIWEFLKLMRKMNRRLDRDESLRQDYPPHRHFNGSILYPADYPPPEVERLKGTVN